MNEKTFHTIVGIIIGLTLLAGIGVYFAMQSPELQSVKENVEFQKSGLEQYDALPKGVTTLSPEESTPTATESAATLSVTELQASLAELNK